MVRKNWPIPEREKRSQNSGKVVGDKSFEKIPHGAGEKEDIDF